MTTMTRRPYRRMDRQLAVVTTTNGGFVVGLVSTIGNTFAVFVEPAVGSGFWIAPHRVVTVVPAVQVVDRPAGDQIPCPTPT